MSRTIKTSLDSLKSSATSLESSLTKCKTSIKNKGVNVPSTTTFSGLPALIDRIVTDPEYTIRINYTTQAIQKGRFRWKIKNRVGSGQYYSDEFEIKNGELNNDSKSITVPGVPSGRYVISLENLNTNTTRVYNNNFYVGNSEYNAATSTLIIVYDDITLSGVYLNDSLVDNLVGNEMLPGRGNCFNLTATSDNTLKYYVTLWFPDQEKRKFNDYFTMPNHGHTYVLDVKQWAYYLYEIDDYGHLKKLKMATSYTVVS